MSEPKWTPGPWSVAHRTVYALVDDPTWLDAKGVPRQVNRFSALIGSGGPYAAGVHEQEANARLIASAPELYAACEGMIAEWAKFTRYGSPIAKASNEAMNAARAALAKARGEAP